MVLGLPRGGVPVAFEVARALGVPFDVFLVRKLGAPGQEELAMGAIASGGVVVINDEVVDGLRIPWELVESEIARERMELTRRELLYRGGRRPIEVRGRIVILVDDGLATGSTMRAAVQGPAPQAAGEDRRRRPHRGAVDLPRNSRSIADACICSITPGAVPGRRPLVSELRADQRRGGLRPAGADRPRARDPAEPERHCPACEPRPDRRDVTRAPVSAPKADRRSRPDFRRGPDSETRTERRSWVPARRSGHWNARRRSRPGGERCGGSSSLPRGTSAVVVFAHGSGSGRFSPRNQFVARVLQQSQLGTLLIDLLEDDEADDRSLVFDIGLLADRLQAASDWLTAQRETRGMRLGYFGASTGAGAALVAAARCARPVGAVVSRGGRPDLAREILPAVTCPTLLIVGGDDEAVLELNREAYALLRCPRQLEIVPGASHLFSEPGTLEEVARLAEEWFVRHLVHDPAVSRPGPGPVEGRPVARPGSRLDAFDPEDFPCFPSRPSCIPRISRSRRSMPCGSPAHWPATTRHGCSSCTWSSRRSTTGSWG